jgi:hypothetical protein
MILAYMLPTFWREPDGISMYGACFMYHA